MTPRRARLLPAWTIAVAMVASALWFADARDRLPDFEVYRTAAARALHAEPLYRPDDGHWQFKYLPAFAIAATPVALVPSSIARPAWFALSVALLVWFVRASVAAVPEPRLGRRAFTWLAILLLGRFYVQELVLGQTNVLLGCLLVAALSARVAGRSRVAGVLVGVACFVKPYAAILLPWLLLTGGGAVAGVAVLVVAAGLLLPVVPYGWDGNLALLAGWWQTVTSTVTPNLTFPENISVASMWAKWLGPSEAAGVAAWLTVAVLAAAVGVVLGARRHVARPEWLEFGLLMLLVPLVSPQGWDYLLLLATPAVLCLVNAWPPAWPARLLYGGALGVVGFTIFDLVGRAQYAWLTGHAVVSVAALVIVAALVHTRIVGRA